MTQPPPVDGRTYRQLVDEAIARIPVHNREWSNYNDADPGITLLQLWAYMSETLMYRSSLIPERNRQAFLRLLGYARQPAQAAVGLVAFTNERGPLDAPVLDADVEVTAGSVPFRTDNGLALLPVAGKVFVKQRAAIPDTERDEVEREYQALYASFSIPGVGFDYYVTTEVDWAAGQPADLTGTVDGALWLALLARPGESVELARGAIANQVLTLGVAPDVPAPTRVLHPGLAGGRAAGSGLEFALPNIATPLPDDPAGRVATYLPVIATGDTDLLATPGVVQLELPDRARIGSWDLDPTEDGVGAFPPALEGDDADRLVTWLRIRATTSDGAAAGGARFRWLGANAAMVQQRTHVPLETLGRGTGEADQQVQLTGVPVLPESLRLSVDGTVWRQLEDLTTAAPELPLAEGSAPVLADPVERVDVYTVDRESGLVRFGDGLHGRRPPAGTVITATYDYGGGRAGLVAAGALTKGPALPTGVKVTNPVPTWGGSEPQSVDAAEKQITGFVRHRDRLVTPADFADVVAGTPGIDLGRVEVLPLYHPELDDVASPGVVTLMLLPRYDPVHRDTPEPDAFFLDAVCAHLDPRRLATTELHLRGPEYVLVWLSVGFEAMPDRDVAVVRETLKAALRAFPNALTGGMFQLGWPLSTDLERLEAWAVATRVDGVAKVTDVLLCGADGVAADRIPMTGLQLPRLVSVAVRQGPPQPLDEVLGTAAAQPEIPVLPIPFVPAEC
jgi:hypothetical protein